jgi:clan AA aspartic protease (TIGR02281 family)
MDTMTYEFYIYRRSIIVYAQIKSVKEIRNVKFILDTGASKTVIDNSTAINLGFDLKRLETGNMLISANGGIGSKKLKLPQFSLFDKILFNFEVNVLDLPPQLTYFADGLIGMDFLLQFESIKFNFDKKIIETS